MQITTIPVPLEIPLQSKPVRDYRLWRASESYVQSNLRRLLDHWGPNGERWCSGVDRYGRGRVCAVNGFDLIVGDINEHRRERAALIRASEKMGFGGSIVRCSDSGFSNARKMVLRAISLAATP